MIHISFSCVDCPTAVSSLTAKNVDSQTILTEMLVSEHLTLVTEASDLLHKSLCDVTLTVPFSCHRLFRSVAVIVRRWMLAVVTRSAVARWRNSVKQTPRSFDFISPPPSGSSLLLFPPTPSRLSLCPPPRRAQPLISQLTQFIKANNKRENVACASDTNKS